jgi:hypothetical protein
MAFLMDEKRCTSPISNAHVSAVIGPIAGNVHEPLAMSQKQQQALHLTNLSQFFRNPGLRNSYFLEWRFSDCPSGQYRKPNTGKYVPLFVEKRLLTLSTGVTMIMKNATFLCAVFVCASLGAAKEHPDYQTGKILQMDSTSCGMQEKGSKTVTGEIFGTDGQHKRTQELLCQEYTVQSDRVIYRSRPKDDKHPVLLPVGETAHFRLHKDKLILQVPEADGKEREYIVVSMTPRQDAPQLASKN